MKEALVKPNAQYNLAAPDSLSMRITARMRRQMFASFQESVRPKANETILDVGVTSDRTYECSNYFEAWYPYKTQITACGLDDASFLEQQYPGVRFVRANGLDMPFPDNSFDVVHSSAVIEHVGDEENQLQFLIELSRVARRRVFLTTPNRWFPVEVHTQVPFLHWLPARTYRAVLRHTPLHFFAREENLNLLSRGSLLRLCKRAGVSARCEHVRLCGWPSNLLLTIHKNN